jgi:hypothetical protein
MTTASGLSVRRRPVTDDDLAMFRRFPTSRLRDDPAPA